MNFTVTDNDVIQAEQSAGLHLTEKERKTVAAQLNKQISSYSAVTQADCDENADNLLPRRGE